MIEYTQPNHNFIWFHVHKSSPQSLNVVQVPIYVKFIGKKSDIEINS